MRKYISFIRHGECLSNIDPTISPNEDVLSEHGTRQATAVANYFKYITIDALYHSGTIRTLHTAQEIAKATKTTPQVQELFKERHGTHFPHTGYEYAESFHDFTSRLREAKHFLESLMVKHTVIVSHAIFLKSLACYLTHGDSITEDMLLGFTDTLNTDNGSISTSMFNEEKKKWRIMCWNNTLHLPK